MAGKLIVFEGIDGSGKSTQVKLFPADKKLSFPRYDTLVGKLIRFIYFHNLFNRLSPYVTTFLFAFDRWLAKPIIIGWLKQGKTIVLDRYTYSSLAHQGSKQKNLINWIYWLEFKMFRLPQPDKVIYLKIDPVVAQKLMKARRKDMAEADLAYQQATARLYEFLAKKFNFTVINCLDSKNRLLSKDDVRRKIKSAIG
ncbi:dTMP kinase [Candidatus Beckwithbacteria bacterium CG22_combo_CG10-13_8_21_14_all_01_47_9]|uniref:Thymidylate kinase n=5 Tax=Candidatus Beckwithiibacteriota TaxID=1752726 RepID=A0A2H0E1A1_9BACT|nr:MAG: dTMP kinase [Candidatus Beckwithbacteria bacterium CG1_02_47_37]PIP52205.1 MAG: dTMP kinase [Candidatus Beckwithbacteria bacterium CG23_combo_of_CG06-09_8_20_14_all_47_9]PIP87918.1 MAG: dTMP kinase [Candidatus Beckwithbacteria bacterium CG22_combo_CG10-13_8_21_14_all_01_47_9]PJA22307.1 MAG: dTMP kinase [Candidatus Beckwithbacteria bacterium CG_4_10_14_0_2_um_filter_47_25]PJC66235.1 MAG: dTMP kinase [Candidatus Beckwithbacteria bacterium CG_4_9_14_0_2_um_filter_47_11]